MIKYLKKNLLTTLRKVLKTMNLKYSINLNTLFKETRIQGDRNTRIQVYDDGDDDELCSRYRALPEAKKWLCSQYRARFGAKKWLCSRYRALPEAKKWLCSRYRALPEAKSGFAVNTEHSRRQKTPFVVNTIDN